MRENRDPEREGPPPPRLQSSPRGLRWQRPPAQDCTLLLWPRSPAAMGPWTPLLTLLLLSWSGPLQGQQHHLVEYMERRLVALEVSDSSLLAPPGRVAHFRLVHPVCQASRDHKTGLCKNLQKNPIFQEDPQNCKLSSPRTRNYSDLGVLPPGLDGIEGQSGRESWDCGDASQDKLMILLKLEVPRELCLFNTLKSAAS